MDMTAAANRAAALVRRLNAVAHQHKIANDASRGDPLVNVHLSCALRLKRDVLAAIQTAAGAAAHTRGAQRAAVEREPQPPQVGHARALTPEPMPQRERTPSPVPVLPDAAAFFLQRSVEETAGNKNETRSSASAGSSATQPAPRETGTAAVASPKRVTFDMGAGAKPQAHEPDVLSAVQREADKHNLSVHAVPGKRARGFPMGKFAAKLGCKRVKMHDEDDDALGEVEVDNDFLAFVGEAYADTAREVAAGERARFARDAVLCERDVEMMRAMSRVLLFALSAHDSAVAAQTNNRAVSVQAQTTVQTAVSVPVQASFASPAHAAVPSKSKPKVEVQHATEPKLATGPRKYTLEERARLFGETFDSDSDSENQSDDEDDDDEDGDEENLKKMNTKNVQASSSRLSVDYVLNAKQRSHEYWRAQLSQ